VDDLILNTAGASLAYLLYAAARRVVSGSRMLQTT
jgi:glycopeptide antibiotics resistance protein